MSNPHPPYTSAWNAWEEEQARLGTATGSSINRQELNRLDDERQRKQQEEEQINAVLQKGWEDFGRTNNTAGTTTSRNTIKSDKNGTREPVKKLNKGSYPALLAATVAIVGAAALFNWKPDQPILPIIGAVSCGFLAYRFHRQITYLAGFAAVAAGVWIFLVDTKSNTQLSETKTSERAPTPKPKTERSATTVPTTPTARRPQRIATMTDGRLWDMVEPKLGRKVYGGMFTDGEPDLRIASKWKISKQELINGSYRDTGFQRVLDRMGLPDPIDNTDMQRIHTALYAYQVLKHEGKPGFEDRVAGIFAGKGLLDEAERTAILAALRGDSPSAIVPNTQFDMQLFKHTYTHDRNADQDTASQSDAWFTKEFAGASGTTLTSEQAAQRFWNFEAGYCKFPREFVRKEISPDTIKAMKSVPGLEDVREGMKYEDLQGGQIKAYFEWRERMEPNTYPPGTAEKAAEYLKTIEQHHTAVEFWDNGRGKVEHAQIFLAALQRRMNAEADQQEPNFAQ